MAKCSEVQDQRPEQLRALHRGGRIDAAGLEFFDKVSGALEGDTARVRAARRAALHGVAAALVRQQGYMLAQIIVEIHAPDLAVGDVGGAGVAASGDDDDDLFGSVHRHADDADLIDSSSLMHMRACP